MDQFNSKSYKALQDKWYKKAGFEVEFSEFYEVKTPGRYIYDEYGHERFLAKERYYQLAGQFLYDYSFKTQIQKKIWELHSEGITIRQIAEILRLSKSVIHRNIKYLKEQMIKNCLKENNNE